MCILWSILDAIIDLLKLLLIVYLVILLSQIFTNFLSSVMIHATRPFVVNEWIQTKIQGYEVSGTVEVCVNLY